MAWVEQTEKRSRKAKHFYDSMTGQYRAEFRIDDVHYKDNNGQWQDVDETLIDDGADGFDKKNDKTRHQFRIKGGGAYRWYPRRDVLTEYVDITEIQYFSNRWRTLNLPSAVWKAQSAEWDMANLYASITNTWRRIKSDFILKNSSAYTRLRFAVAFTGLSYNHDTGELTSTTDGLVWGSIDKPTAQDANEADVPVTATYDGTYIEWSVDTTGATFPIYVDPTFTDGYGGDATTYIDTFVYEGTADTNYGTNAVVGASNYGTAREIGLYKFNVSSLSGSTVTDAKLSLYVGAVSGVNHNLTLNSILSANSGWTEAGATWNYAVASTTRWAGDTGNNGGTDAGCSVSGTDWNATALGTFTYTALEAQDTLKEVDLSDTQVQSWIDTGNYGFVLRSNVTSNNYTYYRSSDYATDATKRPKLVVEYTEVATAGRTGTLTATLSNVTYDLDGKVALKIDLSKNLSNITSTLKATADQTADTSKTLDGISETSSGATSNYTDLSATLESIANTSSGTGAIGGSSDESLGNDTFDAEVDVAIVSNLSKTLENATLSSSGTIGYPPITGTLEQTLDSITNISSGFGAISGSSDETLGTDTFDSEVDVAIVSNLSSTLGNVTLSSSGAVGTLTATATLDVTLDDIANTSSGSNAIGGTSEDELDDDTFDSEVDVAINSTLSVTLANATLSSSGVVGASLITATLSITLDSIANVSSATNAVGGDTDETLGEDTFDAEVDVAISSSLSQTLENVTLSSSGTIAVLTTTATLSATLDDIANISNATNAIGGESSGTLDGDTFDAEADVSIYGDTSSTLDGISSSFSGYLGLKATGTLDVTLAAVTLIATGVVTPLPVSTFLPKWKYDVPYYDRSFEVSEYNRKHTAQKNVTYKLIDTEGS